MFFNSLQLRSQHEAIRCTREHNIIKKNSQIWSQVHKLCLRSARTAATNFSKQAQNIWTSPRAHWCCTKQPHLLTGLFFIEHIIYTPFDTFPSTRALCISCRSASFKNNNEPPSRSQSSHTICIFLFHSSLPVSKQIHGCLQTREDICPLEHWVVVKKKKKGGTLNPDVRHTWWSGNMKSSF